MDSKYCNGCKRDLPLDNFNYRLKRDKAVVRSRCKECEKAYAKKRGKAKIASGEKSKYMQKYRDKNPEYARRGNLRHFARRICIQPELLLDYVATHPRLCDICKQPETSVGTLHIDHNHNSNDVRGMLCSPCNVGLGYFKDNPTLLAEAIAYLQKKPAIISENKPIPLPKTTYNDRQALIRKQLESGELVRTKRGKYGFAGEK